MTALKAPRGQSVCVGACVAMILLLATASGAMASFDASLVCAHGGKPAD